MGFDFLSLGHSMIHVLDMTPSSFLLPDQPQWRKEGDVAPGSLLLENKPGKFEVLQIRKFLCHLYNDLGSTGWDLGFGATRPDSHSDFRIWNQPQSLDSASVPTGWQWYRFQRSTVSET